MLMEAVIWDLDGTLLDSYDIIVNSLYQIYTEKGIRINKKEIFHDVITESVSAFIVKMEQRFGVPFDTLKDRYSHISHQEILNIKAMKHAKEILSYLKEHNVHNYVFTHRGVTTDTVLKNIGLYDYFDEIVNSLHGFKRKPDPEALLYLVDKYHLDKEHTYYVGDRRIDIECANNAHIKSIMFIPSGSPAEPTGKETHVVADLLEIESVFEAPHQRSLFL